MIPCLTKTTTGGNQGFSLVEMLLAVAFALILLTGIYSFYNASSQTYSAGVSGTNLQTAANLVLSKITEGDMESGTIYRLETGTSYMIPNGSGTTLYTCGGTAQATACNASNPYGELYYCLDGPPCTYSDSTARWYYLNSQGTSIMYHHPGAATDTAIYTAPSGSTISLMFYPGQISAQTNVAATSSSKVVSISVDLSETVSAKVTNLRLATSGDTTAYVLLRNHP